MMILLIHNDRIIRHIEIVNTDAELEFEGYVGHAVVSVLLELAQRFPAERIAWIHETLKEETDYSSWEDLLTHPLELLSWEPGKHHWMSAEIERVDFSSPFVNTEAMGGVRYATWMVSTSMGIAHAGLLQKFSIFSAIDHFPFFLTMAARLGMEQGVLTYLEPAFSRHKPKRQVQREEIDPKEFFSFIKTVHGKKSAIFYLLQKTIYRIDNVYSWWAYLCAPKYDFPKLELDALHKSMLKHSVGSEEAIDVIIPTLGRKKYLYDVLVDLSKQTLLPKNIIIVEQNPEPDAVSELDYLVNEKWPFAIKHTFTHQTGACNARNIAIRKIASEWTFFADDDIRMTSTTLENSLAMMKSWNLDAATLAVYRQTEEIEKKNHPILWHTFGSGCSLVKSAFAKNILFDVALEFGYGEDADYGMTLRRKGCSIAFVSAEPMLHLKAPIGGFRSKFKPEWSKDNPLPKPSPTVMYYMKKQFTEKQLCGNRIFHLYKRVIAEKPINFFGFYGQFKQQWNKSIYWAGLLSQRARR